MARCRLEHIVVLVVVMLTGGVAAADGRTSFLIDRLRSDDYRVRTNAALALGATNDDAAVQPLCGALNDGSDVVRIAAAAALQRLGRSSALSCLRGRLSSEGAANVRGALTRAIDALAAGGGGGGGAPPTVPNARFYVAISVGQNSSGRDSAQVMNAITNKLASIGGYQLAPHAESPAAAQAVMQRRNLKGFFLTVSIELVDTSQGMKGLVRIAVASYPGHDLRGEVAPYAIASGVRKGDPGAEESLLEAVAERAAEQFSQSFQ